MKRIVLAACLAASPAVAEGPPATRVKNVVLMVADGAGFNTWAASAMYQGKTGAAFYDGPGWVRLALSTYPLRAAADAPVSGELGATQVPSFVYDPLRAWDPAPVFEGPGGRFPWYFAGYKWLRETRPDSANTMTAMVTGQQTYNGAINVDGRGQPIERTLASLARADGRRVGVVTDVQFSHATPAAGAGAHAADREAYCALAIEMLTTAGLDLIVGTGNPDYDNNGQPISEPEQKQYRYVGGAPAWGMLTGGRDLKPGNRACGADGDGSAAITLDDGQIEALRRWTLVQKLDEIAKLRKLPPSGRLLVVPTVGEISFPRGHEDAEGDERIEIGTTLQQQRGSRADPRYTPPGYDPPVAGVPTLAALSRMALDALGSDDRGFFLVIEGGAIDWAMHEGQMGRMVEETMAFEEAVRATTSWIDERQAWSDSLVVIVADHDHLLWGPSSDTEPFQPLRDKGAGKLPGYRWLADEHSNALVPLFARGAGAERFEHAADREDPFRGRYLHQTDVFHVLEALIGP